MPTLNINSQSGKNQQGKLKLNAGGNTKTQGFGSLKLNPNIKQPARQDDTIQIEEEQAPSKQVPEVDPELLGFSKPERMSAIPDNFDQPIDLEEQSLEDEEVLGDENDDEEDEDNRSSKGKRNKRKDKKRKEKKQKSRKKRKGSSSDDEKDEKSVEKEYKSYRVRKIVLYVVVILFMLGLLFFGTYNTFFKHIPTFSETTAAVNKYNGQTQVQQWDSGVDGYLQSNLKEIMTNNVTFSNTVKDFSVDNISVEKNEQVSRDSLICFFSADISTEVGTERMFFTLPLMIKENKFIQAGALEMSALEPFTSDATTVEVDPLLDFNEKDIEKEKSEEFEKVLNNFLTLGYNSKQDVSNIYKGKKPLEFNGTFENIQSCTVYAEPNQLGFNTLVEYNVKLPNGLTYTTTSYMAVEGSEGSYTINSIL